jgi:hypothetical protein
MFCVHCSKEIPENSLYCPYCQSKQINVPPPYAPAYSLPGKKNMVIALILACFLGVFALLFYAPLKKSAILIGIQMTCNLLYYLAVAFTGNQHSTIALCFLLIGVIPYFVAIFQTYHAVKEYNDDLKKKYMKMPMPYSG